jgi:hypothetical protein
MFVHLVGLLARKTDPSHCKAYSGKNKSKKANCSSGIQTASLNVYTQHLYREQAPMTNYMHTNTHGISSIRCGCYELHSKVKRIKVEIQTLFPVVLPPHNLKSQTVSIFACSSAPYLRSGFLQHRMHGCVLHWSIFRSWFWNNDIKATKIVVKEKIK